MKKFIFMMANDEGINTNFLTIIKARDYESACLIAVKNILGNTDSNKIDATNLINKSEIDGDSRSKYFVKDLSKIDVLTE